MHRTLLNALLEPRAFLSFDSIYLHSLLSEANWILKPTRPPDTYQVGPLFINVLLVISALTQCSVPLYLQLFGGGIMSYYVINTMFGFSLPPVVCRREHVLLRH